MMRILPRTLLLLLLALAATVPAVARFELVLPTRNDAIFNGVEEEFYQRTAKNSDDAWKSGRYGYVRNPRTISGETVFTRFHEGVDIRPVARDEKGEPLDSVLAISRGTVVHVNDRPGASNYGRYIVIEHRWDGSPFYSLYAHLNEVWIDSGAQVGTGEPIGRLGYTGAGINRDRAHLHFEICMLLSRHFDLWYEMNHSSRDLNKHGIFNGRNLVGLDVVRFYAAHRDDRRFRIRSFLEQERTSFTLRIPRVGRIDLLDRYAWLQEGSAASSARSWEISFNESGIPLKVMAVEEETPEPVVCFIEEAEIPYRYTTRAYLRGSGKVCTLAPAGAKLVDLLTLDPDAQGHMLRVDKGDVAVGEEDDE